MRRDRAPASLTSTDSASRTVKVITATTSRKEPDYAGQPNYKGQGDLLRGPCSQTGFTQVDAGNTVYYAGFVGCIRDRPECCPYAVDTAMGSAQATDAAGIQVQDNKDLGFDFPQPVSSDSGMQTKCAEDYYSISGGCCPNGFWPFTSAVGGQTPCWSSIPRVTAPTLTREKDATTKAKPTSAVVNIVWSMRYPVADAGSSGLSTAAKAGIGAGVGVAVILIAGLAICLWRSRRKNKKLEKVKQGIPPPGTLAQPAQPQMMQQPPHGHYPPPGTLPPGTLPPGTAMAPPSDQTGRPGPLMPQHTGASAGAVSSLSSGTGLLHNGHNPRLSYSSSGGGATPSPAQYPPQQQQQQFPPQQQQQQFPPQQQQQQQHATASEMGAGPEAGPPQEAR
ncbi:hypothetical protein BT67DRAFT_382592 [Trichocladium antarcticum]|uniref:Uncharacterized protein n=1 Tax=Trichocladium antarcticum TaxID=1450529 RepID=A0AAN6ZC00_9PEZI|nr:hypothetical protein BT67DRAFT_382592 [Trichocladium antarcticum]